MTESELLKDIEDNIKDENTKEVLKKILSKIEEKENVNKNDWVFQELSKTISSEYDLMSQRISSLLLSNSFLITTFVLIITRLSCLQQKDFPKSLGWFLLLLLLLISITGLIISLLSCININAALLVVENRRKRMIKFQKKVLKGLELNKKLLIKVSKDENDRINGDLLYKTLPGVFICLWLIFIVMVLVNC